ncbi:hypothetical protein L1987_83760 [Smallanthus sonchifolius]|uniref:Uncharacterized protein n=2 Tax=Smallanthus sonchifolius TaxID=185202 RepID=A0ACB8YDH3_9ASTR|nr:hypothetical protein L1987_83753 [Smallanthus sonchifolius]KAI3683257.1 hypothetical protein L1987_83760 [Smallanthus sonchifolius]
MDDEIRFIGSWLTERTCHAMDVLTIVGMSINARCTEHFHGLLDLQKQLCGDISKNIQLQVYDVSVYTLKIKDALADRDVAEIILNACDIDTIYGITNLTDRCLLRIGWENKLMMHQLVQEMGRDLVRQENPENPWERSRLWCHEESFKVLKQKKVRHSVYKF